jgi:hypothetical protein
MRNRNLYLNCLRQTAKVYRRGTFDHWTAVACLATCIDIQMRQAPADPKTSPEFRDAAAVPALDLPQPLSKTDQVLQDLYPEAIEFWVLRYGQPRLMK